MFTGFGFFVTASFRPSPHVSENGSESKKPTKGSYSRRSAGTIASYNKERSLEICKTQSESPRKRMPNALTRRFGGSLRRPITDCVRDIEERKQRPSERKRRKGATEKNKRQIGKEGKKKKRRRRPVKRRNLKGEGYGG